MQAGEGANGLGLRLLRLHAVQMEQAQTCQIGAVEFRAFADAAQRVHTPVAKGVGVGFFPYAEGIQHNKKNAFAHNCFTSFEDDGRRTPRACAGGAAAPHQSYLI